MEIILGSDLEEQLQILTVYRYLRIIMYITGRSKIVIKYKL